MKASVCSSLLPGKLLVIAVAVLVSTSGLAETAKGSPKASISQTVDRSEIAVYYSRPGVRGRVIWGELVPYGEIWRAGANAKTNLDFSDDVVIEGTAIPAGTYSFYIIATETEWTLIINSDWMGHGTDHNKSADVIRFKATPTDAPHEEWLRYGFENLEKNATTIYLHWGEKKVTFRVELAK